MKIKISNGSAEQYFEGRTSSREKHYIKVSKGNEINYLDLTRDKDKTTQIGNSGKYFQFLNGVETYYIRTVYFTVSQQFEQYVNTYRCGENPNPWEVTQKMDGYDNITIGINSNIVLSGVHDRSGSSTNENYRFKWKFWNMSYDYYHSNENNQEHLTRPVPTPNDLNLTTLETLKSSSEWNINITRSELSTSWKTVYKKSYSGGGRTATIIISAYIDSTDILHIKFETLPPAPGGRNSATCGKHIKLGIIVY